MISIGITPKSFSFLMTSTLCSAAPISMLSVISSTRLRGASSVFPRIEVSSLSKSSGRWSCFAEMFTLIFGGGFGQLLRLPLCGLLTSFFEHQVTDLEDHTRLLRHR